MIKEYRISRVLEIRPGPAPDIIQIVSDATGELWIDTKRSRIDHLETLYSSLTEKKPIVIHFDAKTREIEWVKNALIDPIVLLSDPKGSGEEVQVASLKSPRLFRLRKDHPRFSELYALLAKAYAERDKGTKAALAFPGGSDYIFDVVLVPAKAE